MASYQVSMKTNNLSESGPHVGGESNGRNGRLDCSHDVADLREQAFRGGLHLPRIRSRGFDVDVTSLVPQPTCCWKWVGGTKGNEGVKTRFFFFDIRFLSQD